MVFGFQRVVEHLDGSLVVFNRTEPSPPGTELRISRRGFRHFEVDDAGPSDERGDFVVKVELAVPSTDSGEKQEFKDSAFALADADDAPSIRAAELIGKDDAVIAAKGLAGEAENDFLKALRHAVNIALPFSDKTAKTIEKRHDHFAKLDEMVAELEACRKPKTGCGCGPAAAPACTCGKDDCAQCACDPCKGGRKGNHARLDVVWD